MIKFIKLAFENMNYQLKLNQILDEFEKLTGKGILINTSFNVRGEPIVCTPGDAIRGFIDGKLDYLVINNFLIKKK